MKASKLQSQHEAYIFYNSVLTLRLEFIQPQKRIFGNHLQCLINQFLISLWISGCHVNIIIVGVGTTRFIVAKADGGEGPYTVIGVLRNDTMLEMATMMITTTTMNSAQQPYLLESS